MLLTEQEVDDIQLSLMRVKQHGVQNFARAIESAVLEKLKAQEPVGHVVFKKHRKAPDVDWAVNTPIRNGIPLYSHPDPRVAELEAVLRECREVMWKAWHSGTPHTSSYYETIAKIDEVLNEDR